MKTLLAGPGFCRGIYAVGVFAVMLGVALSFVNKAVGAEVPLPELRALQRAIDSGLNNRELGSQTIGELQRLRDRLENERAVGDADRIAVLSPLEDVSVALAEVPSGDADIQRLQKEAAEGKRSSLRTLALYRLYQNNPEEALRLWDTMGDANPNDLAYRLMASYLELALGEHERARTHLEAADRLIGTRTGLGLSAPVFCENIAGYRLYVPRPSNELLPGENTLIYVEVEGADFQTIGKDESECRLMFGIRLKNDAGTTVWSDSNYGEYSPVFNGPIRDLHTALTWRVPNDLAPGVYTLIVEAVEESSKRRGDVTMEFSVGRRATNPEPKLDDATRRDVNKALQDAGKMFPGASSQYFKTEEERGAGGFRNSERYFDLLKQNERMNRGAE